MRLLRCLFASLGASARNDGKSRELRVGGGGVSLDIIISLLYTNGKQQMDNDRNLGVKKGGLVPKPKSLEMLLSDGQYELAAHRLVYALVKAKVESNGKKRSPKRQSKC